jgi:hypothetical protein
MHEPVFTQFAPTPVGHLFPAVLANGVLYGAGQLGLDPVPERWCSSDTPDRRSRCSGTSSGAYSGRCFDADVVRVTVYLVDLSEFAAVVRYTPFLPRAATRQDDHPGRGTSTGGTRRDGLYRRIALKSSAALNPCGGFES